MSINKNLSITLYSQVNINRKNPINTVNALDIGFYNNVNLTMPQVNLHHYFNVNITPEGLVFKNLKLFKNLLIYPKHKSTYNIIYLLSTLVKRKKIILPSNNTYLLCFDYWSNSIFHWMCDALPRIEAVKTMTKDLVLILPKHFEYAYIHETLKAYQFKDIFYLSDNTYLNCKKLIVPEHVTTSGQIRPDNIINVRQTLLTHFATQFTNKAKYKNIYISRSKARFRKVNNEGELLPILKKYNFEIIYFEDCTVLEQIEICYHAKNIVSIHGANLTNIIFLQPNNNVLELRKKNDYDNNYYYELADSINCNYYYLNCDFEDPKPNTNTFNLHVNLNEFETSLKLLLNE